MTEIDQSGKVEKTSKNTVLALSNDFWDAVIIIGKLSPAHDIAAKITHKKQEAKYEINLGKILRLIKKTEVGKRLKDA